MLAAPDNGYRLTLASTLCHGPAWWCLNSDTLRDGAPTEGVNVVLPDVAGRVPRLRRTEERVVDLQFVFTGSVDPTGDAHASAEIGLEENLDAFVTAVVNATPDATGCISASLVMPSDAVRTGLVQIVGFQTGTGLYDCPAVLTISIPAGALYS